MLWKKPATSPVSAGTDASLAVMCCAVPVWCLNGPPKKQDPASFRSHLGITLFIISRESAFFRATGLLKLPWAGWTPWDLSCITSSLSCYTPRSGFFSLLMRKIRKICIGTNSHAYVHIAPSTFPKSIIHLLCLYLLCLMGKCLAVTMRILG